jgi:hypothetical protein
LTWKVGNAFSATMQACFAFTSASGGGIFTGSQQGYMANGIYSGTAIITPTAVGTYTYAITCGGVESGVATVQVSAKTNTVVTAGASPNPVLKNQSGVLSATLKTSSGTALSAATVNFLLGTAALGSAKTNSSGVATLEASASVPTGSYSLTAQFSGDANNNGSSANFSADIVNQTSTTVSITPSTFTAGSTVTIAASVSAGQGADATPTGNVALLFSLSPTTSGSEIGLLPALQNGLASENAPTTGFPPGTYYVYTIYQGDTHSAPSTSPRVTVTIQ